MVIFTKKRSEDGPGEAGELNYAQIWEESENALRRTDRYTKAGRNQRTKYHGPAHSSEVKWDSDYGPENTYGEYISLVIPKIIFDNPRIKVGTKRAEAQREVAKALEVGLNRWIRDVNLRRFIATGPAVDMLFNWGVVMVEREEQDRQVDGKDVFIPKPRRVSPDDFFEDPLADCRDEIRFSGRRFRIDIDDLEARAKDEEGWNRDVVNRAAADWDYGDKRKDVMYRHEVEIREIYVPEIETDSDEENVNGTILTLVALQGQDDGDLTVEQIREPRAFYGPRWGPYTVFGVYTVPDDTRPLAPLQMAEAQIIALNEHALAADVADRKYKQCVFVDAAQPDVQKALKSGPDQYIIPLKNATKETFFQTAEIGGSSPQQQVQIAVRHDRVDRALGISDAKSGNAKAGVTATSDQIASESSDIRIDFVKQQLTDALVQVLRTVAWYMYHDNEVLFPLGDVDDLDYAEMPSPWFQGGTDEEGDATYDDLELDIEPYSMERANEGLNQQRAVQVFDLLTNVAQIAPTAPFIDWKSALKKIGDAMNMPELSEVFDQDMAMAMTQQQATQGTPPERTPRMGKASSNRGPQRAVPVVGPQAQPQAQGAVA